MVESGVSSVRGWLIVGVTVLLSLFAFLWRSGPTKIGDQFGTTFTLVPEDLTGSQTALLRPAKGRVGQFRWDERRNRAVPLPPDRTGRPPLRAHWTTDRMLFVVDGLEALPEVAAEGRKKAQQPKELRRFEVTCQVRVDSWTDGGKVRWLGRTGWDPLWPMWVVSPTSCFVVRSHADG